jgi:small subunit ribosomal protein S6
VGDQLHTRVKKHSISCGERGSKGLSEGQQRNRGSAARYDYLGPVVGPGGERKEWKRHRRFLFQDEDDDVKRESLQSMRTYEIMFILKPNATEEEMDKLIGQMEAVVTSHKGEIVGVEKMGKKKLAYSVLKFEEGFYVLFRLNADGECVKEFERRLRVMDLVIRYITVRVDEALKRVDKIKAARLKKVKKKTSRKLPETVPPVI